MSDEISRVGNEMDEKEPEPGSSLIPAPLASEDAILGDSELASSLAEVGLLPLGKVEHGRATEPSEPSELGEAGDPESDPGEPESEPGEPGTDPGIVSAPSGDTGDTGPDVPAFPEEPTPEDVARLTSILLAVLFASEEPLTGARLAHAAGATAALARRGLDALSERIREQGLPFDLLESAGTFRIVTHPLFHPHILRLRAVKKNERLSPAALETLAIIAYRQPIIRAEIEAIRGVKAGPLLRTLLDKKLVRVAGRSEVPGRPILYGTTREFLDRFGIASPKDLPSLGELKLGQV